MAIFFEVLRVTSIATFLFYGFACVFAGSMTEEFERFGLSRFRVLVGVLEILGAIGLLATYWWTALLLPSAGGLCLLMVLGVGTRVRVHDSFLETLPALALCIFTGVLCYAGPGAL